MIVFPLLHRLLNLLFISPFIVQARESNPMVYYTLYSTPAEFSHDHPEGASIRKRASGPSGPLASEEESIDNRIPPNTTEHHRTSPTNIPELKTNDNIKLMVREKNKRERGIVWSFF